MFSNPLNTIGTALTGITSDLRNWHRLPGDTGVDKLRFVVAQEDRGSVLLLLLLLILAVVTIGVLITEACRKKPLTLAGGAHQRPLLPLRYAPAPAAGGAFLGEHDGASVAWSDSACSDATASDVYLMD